MSGGRFTFPRVLLIVIPLFGLMVSEVMAQCDPQEVAKLVAADHGPGDNLGFSVSISNDTALVGAYWDDDLGLNAGSAYVFEKIGGAWTQVAKLLASDGLAGDAFGCSVSISGNTAIVGAYLDDDRGTDSGSVYVFERLGGVWTQVAKLLAADGAVIDYFGWSVSIDGDALVVGAYFDNDLGGDSGSAYIFERAGGVWAQEAKLLAADGTAGDLFGYSVSISGYTALVGAHRDGENQPSSGSAYFFEKAGGTWMQVAKIVASDEGANDWFGNSVSISGDNTIIGAKRDEDNGTDSGSAYLFEKAGGVWTEVAKIIASDGAASDFFGTSVSISGDAAIVGADGDDDLGDHSGSAYVFAKVGGTWTQVAKILASDGVLHDNFGAAVWISGDAAIAGAPGVDNNDIDSGSAYVFDLHCGGGPRLTVIATCPSGGPIQVSWSGATGGGTIAILFARQTGSFQIPNGNPCAGTQLGLSSNQLQIGYQGAAGSNGTRTVNANAGPGACGGYMQLLDVPTCSTSNVVRVE